jgi:hypothetical protein
MYRGSPSLVIDRRGKEHILGVEKLFCFAPRFLKALARQLMRDMACCRREHLSSKKKERKGGALLLDQVYVFSLSELNHSWK